MPCVYPMKLTPLYHPDQKPARHGVYRVKYREHVRGRPAHGFSYWNGAFFGMISKSPETAGVSRSPVLYGPAGKFLGWQGVVTP